MVLGDPELRVRGRADLLDDPPRELRVRIDPGADGGPSDREFREGRPAGRDTSDSVVNLGLVAGELLPEADRGGVHQVGASRFHDRIELLRLLRQALFEFAEGGQQVVVDLHEGRDVDRGRDHVVRGLAHVHVVVRMDGPFLAERVTEDLVRSVRDHLVRIHVRRRAAPGLEHVEWEVGVQLALHDLLAGLDDCLSDLRIEEAELHVRLGRRHLDQAERIEEAPTEADPADREVFDGPLRLGAPVGLFGDFQFTQEVLLDAVVGHARCVRPTERGEH